MQRARKRRIAQFLGMFAIMAVVLAAPIGYSTLRGYTSWWLGLRGTVKVNGVSGGYMHKNTEGTAIILTRTDTQPRQSYLIGLSKPGLLLDCGGWSAPHSPVFAIGDVNPPCSFFSSREADPKTDRPLAPTLFIQPKHLVFATTSGKRIEGLW